MIELSSYVVLAVLNSHWTVGPSPNKTFRTAVTAGWALGTVHVRNPSALSHTSLTVGPSCQGYCSKSDRPNRCQPLDLRSTVHNPVNVRTVNSPQCISTVDLDLNGFVLISYRAFTV